MKKLLTITLLGCLLAGCAASPASLAPAARFTEEPATPAPAQIIITVNPTAILLSPLQAQTPFPTPTPAPKSAADWQTFHSAALGVSLDLPASWSVTQQPGELTLLAPDGITILVKKIQPGGPSEIRTGTERCTSRVNAHNQTAQVCVNSTVFSYSAKFSGLGLILIASSRAAAAVLEQLFDSVQPGQ